jgi:hypothetical protein
MMSKLTYSHYPELGVGRTEKIKVFRICGAMLPTPPTHYHYVLPKYSDNST